MSSEAKQRNLVDEYYNEQFLFPDGKLYTRREIIEDLKTIDGATPALIDRYLQGLDLMKRIRAKEAEAESSN